MYRTIAVGTDGSETDYILGGLFRDISTSKFGV